MDHLLDLHVYTNNSVCGNDKISFLCEKAAEKGLRGIAFTDICTMDRFDKYESSRRVRHAFFDVSKAKMLFFNSLTVFAGIEFEQAVFEPKATEKIIASQNYDIVLTSVVRPEKGDFGIYPGCSQGEFDAFADEYTALLLRTVNETDFDSLSRTLAPLRNISADYSVFEEGMEKVLKALAEKQKALEVNARDITGSEKIRDLYIGLLSRFASLGGKYLTFGSESCYYNEIGNGVELSILAAKRSGFNSVTFFDERIPYTVSV